MQPETTKLEGSLRDLWQIAYPLMLGGLVQNIIGLTDTAFLGRVGEVELGAVGLASMLYFTFVIVGQAVGSALQVLVARRMGEGRPEAVGLVVDHAMILTVGVSAVLTVALLYITPVLLGSFVQSDAVLKASIEYLNVRWFELPLGLMFLLIRGFYSGIGRTNILIWAGLAMALCNIVLNYILIFGHLGLPAMGMAGAATASLISQGLGLVILLMYLYPKGLKRDFRLFQFEKLKRDVVGQITSLTLPIMLQYFVGVGAFFFFLSFIEQMGERALAVSNVMKGVYLFLMTPVWGWGGAASTVVSNLMGQGRQQDVMKALGKVLVVSMVTMLPGAVMLLVYPDPLLALFTADATIVAESAEISYILSLGLLFISLSGVLIMAIIGLGATDFSLGIEVATFALYLLYTLVAARMLGASLEVAWYAEWVYTFCLGLPSYLYLRSGRWKKLKL